MKWDGWLEDCPFSFNGLCGRIIVDTKGKRTYKSVATGTELGDNYVRLGNTKIYESQQRAGRFQFPRKRYKVLPKR
jgi:hypothetical protein